MYLYNFEVESQRSFPIVSLDTLTYPFDTWTWVLLAGFSTFVFLFLVFIQKLWIHTTGEKPPNGWMFQGKMASCVLWYFLTDNFYHNMWYIFLHIYFSSYLFWKSCHSINVYILSFQTLFYPWLLEWMRLFPMSFSRGAHSGTPGDFYSFSGLSWPTSCRTLTREHCCPPWSQ